MAWNELPELLSAMRANSIGADASTLNAMGLLGLTFVRTSELIAARWEELDLEEALWTIPAERMKGRRGNRREHLVPLLSRQVASLFQAQHAISGPSGYGFQSQRVATSYISNNTVNMALKRMGFEPCPGPAADAPHPGEPGQRPAIERPWQWVHRSAGAGLNRDHHSCAAPLVRYTYADVNLWLARQLELSRG
ncbi:MAG: tyrosine-type recombinase/integrase [Cyanobacteriota bacterium]